jgi:hypothetical protein
VSNNYGCSKCNKTFSRKGNAERHNDNIHDGLATVYDKRLKYNRDADSSKSNFKLKDPLFKNKFIQKQSILDKKKKDKKNQADKLFFRSMNFGFDNDDFTKVMRLFGQLKQPFEELEMSIDENNEEIKTNIIYEIINSALRSSRPVKSLKETVELYKSSKCLDKMTYYISKHDNITIEEAKSNLQHIVQESKHFKRVIN